MITVVLAVVLAWQGQWYIAVPGAIFGVGVGYFAWHSLLEEKRPPGQASAPSPPVAPPEPPVEPPAMPPQPAVPPQAAPPRTASRSGRRRRR